MITLQKALWRVRTTEEQEENVDRTHDILVKLHNSVVSEIYHDHEVKINTAIESAKYTEDADLVRSILRKLL